MNLKDIPTILIYHDRDSKTHIGQLPHILRRDLGNNLFRIAKTDRHNLINSVNSFNPSIVILPEILGEESFYSRHIKSDAQNCLFKLVESGGMLITDCASTYWMGQKVIYHPPKGKTKFRDGSHVFNAAAIKMFGPAPGLWLPSNGKPDRGGCREIDIIVKTANGLEKDKVWYGNGPCILPIGKQNLPDNLEPLAYYATVEDQPIAAAALHIGNGQILMSGPLPHYYGGNVKSNNLLWQVLRYKMHQQLFEKSPYPMLQATP